MGIDGVPDRVAVQAFPHGIRQGADLMQTGLVKKESTIVPRQRFADADSRFNG